MTVLDFILMSEAEVLQTFAELLPGKLTNEYYFFDNKAPICLVAHADTINTKENKKLQPEDLFIKDGILHQKRQDCVLGADDRAGCFVIYSIAKAKEVVPSILITTGEESGRTGVKTFIRENPTLEGIRLFVELDRRGVGEYVTYNDIPQPVKEYAESFGLKEGHGTGSDIADLTNCYKIPSFNISVGYYNEHRENETLDLAAMENAKAKTIEMLKNPIDRLYRLN